MPNQQKKRLRTLCLATAGVGLVLFGYYLFIRMTGVGLFCPFERLTGGLRCPGCGNTRAVMAFLRLDLLTGLRYNYLFPLEAFYLLWVYAVSARYYLKYGKFRYGGLPKGFLALDIAVLTAVLLWWVVRNFLHV